MNGFKKNIFVTWLCVFICSIFFCACENDINEVRALDNKGVNTEEAINIESYMSVDGKTKARLTAPLMLTRQKDTASMTFPKTLHVTFYNDSTGLPDSYVFAKYGIYYKSLKKVLLRDSVIATNLNGDTLRTEELWWDQNTEYIYGSKPATLTRTYPYDYTKGEKGFKAKQDFSEFVFYEINRGIEGVDSTETL